MTTIYLIANNEDFENAQLIKRESLNNVKGYSLTEIVKVAGRGEMNREDFLDLVAEGGVYAYQNIHEELNGLISAFGWEDDLWSYIQKVNVL